MGKRRGILREKEKGDKALAVLTEDERTKMLGLQFGWEELIEQARAADMALTNYRVYIRNRYKLPGQYTIDLGSGEITEMNAPEQVEDSIGTEAS